MHIYVQTIENRKKYFIKLPWWSKVVEEIAENGTRFITYYWNMPYIQKQHLPHITLRLVLGIGVLSCPGISKYGLFQSYRVLEGLISLVVQGRRRGFILYFLGVMVEGCPCLVVQGRRGGFCFIPSRCMVKVGVNNWWSMVYQSVNILFLVVQCKIGG